MNTRVKQYVRFGLLYICTILFGLALAGPSFAAPYAAVVIDARSGEVLHARNADSRLHPASLTKMMTLYVVFEAIEHGELSLDDDIKITARAANEPPSKLGLRAGQTIKLRYLVRAAAVKSANDAATALGIAVEGSEAAFARRMNRTAKALGMTRTTFKNAHGLTEEGHLSTARDMTNLGRHLFFDYPEYYNLFSRRSTDAGIREVPNTNSRFLAAYKGADGIKTGYTRAAGFNLVASAERGNERIIATVFGGRSTAARNARVAELLDMGFSRAPSRVAVLKPRKPAYQGRGSAVAIASAGDTGNEGTAPTADQMRSGMMPAGKIVRVSVKISRSPRPLARPLRNAPLDPADETVLMAMQADILKAVEQAQAAPVAAAPAQAAPVQIAQAPAPEPRPALDAAQILAQTAVAAAAAAEAPAPRVASITPRPRPESLHLASIAPQTVDTQPKMRLSEPEIVTRMSTSGGRHWGINVGTYGSRYQAERILLKTALKEMGTLDDALRKVVKNRRGYAANFVGMNEGTAALACRRLQARNLECSTFGPS
ncbi:MAG: D-alanyl-D-alanine carboxypeptidase family protein [Paracoccaceae bacterium]